MSLWYESKRVMDRRDGQYLSIKCLILDAQMLFVFINVSEHIQRFITEEDASCNSCHPSILPIFILKSRIHNKHDIRMWTFRNTGPIDKDPDLRRMVQNKE